MSVDRDEVQRIARLARLRLEDGEVVRLTDEMNRILEHAERLRSTGTASSEDVDASVEAAPADGMSGVRAESAVPDPLDVAPDAFAPVWMDDFFVVPPPPGVTADEREEGEES